MQDAFAPFNNALRSRGRAYSELNNRKQQQFANSLAELQSVQNTELFNAKMAEIDRGNALRDTGDAIMRQQQQGPWAGGYNQGPSEQQKLSQLANIDPTRATQIATARNTIDPRPKTVVTDYDKFLQDTGQQKGPESHRAWIAQQKDLKRSGAPTVSQSVNSKATQSAIDPFLKDLPKAYESFNADKLAVDRFETALNLVGKHGDKITGLSGDFKAFISPMAAALGMDTEEMTDAQYLKALLSSGAGSLRAEVIGPGPVSNYEQGILQQVSGGKMSAAEGVKKLLTYHKSQKQFKINTFRKRLESASAIEGYDALGSLYPTVIQAPPDAIEFLMQNSSDEMKNAFKTKYGYLPEGF